MTQKHDSPPFMETLDILSLPETRFCGGTHRASEGAWVTMVFGRRCLCAIGFWITTISMQESMTRALLLLLMMMEFDVVGSENKHVTKWMPFC